MSDLAISAMKDLALLQRRQQAEEKLQSEACGTAGSGGTSSDDKQNELAAACQQFESLLLNFMVREMRATVPESTLFPQSMAQDLFTEMLDERLAGEMADHGGIGLSRMIFDQLKDG